MHRLIVTSKKTRLLGGAFFVRWPDSNDSHDEFGLRVAVEKDQITDVLLPFDQFDSVITFGIPKPGYGGLFGTGTKNRTGRAMVAQTGPDEFLLCGFDSIARFMPKQGNPLRKAQFLSAEEGSFEGWAVEDEPAFEWR